MAYVFTGNKRSLTVLITKKDAVGTIVGYPIEYDGRLAFGSYSAITDDEAQKLSETEYNNRLSALYSFIEGIEIGFDSGTDFTNASEMVDLVNCSAATTTTTTVI